MSDIGDNKYPVLTEPFSDLAFTDDLCLKGLFNFFVQFQIILETAEVLILGGTWFILTRVLKKPAWF